MERSASACAVLADCDACRLSRTENPEIVPGKPWSLSQLQHSLRLHVITNQVEHNVKVKLARERKAA